MALTKPPVLPPWADSGDKVQPSDVEIQAGWPLSNVPPSRQRFNWLLNFLSNGIRYLTRRGMPDYAADETYMTGDRIIGDDGKTYRSLIDNNVGHTPSTSPTQWERWGYGASELSTELNKLDYKASCRVTTTANLAALSGLLTVDGITLVAGDRVLVKDQTTGSQNGIYVAAAGAWARASDADGSGELTSGAIVPVEEGTAGADTLWMLTNDGTITIGATSLTFSNIQGNVGTAGTYNSVTTDAKGRVVAGSSFNYLRKNVIINGAFNLAQRSTTYALTAAIAYGSVDRWAFKQATSAAGIANQVASGLTGFPYALKMGRNNGSALTNGILALHAIESANSIPLAGKTVTFSYYAKAGANYSSSGNGLSCYAYTGTGTDQSAASMGTWTGNVGAMTATDTLTTSWQRFSHTFTVGATATQIGVEFLYTPTGTAGADDNVYITGVQLEEGSVATTFESLAYGLELALCQRYFWKIPTGVNYPIGNIVATAGTQASYSSIPFPVSMRASPTASYAGVTWWLLNATFNSLNVRSNINADLVFYSVAAGISQGYANGGAPITFDAEL